MLVLGVVAIVSFVALDRWFPEAVRPVVEAARDVYAEKKALVHKDAILHASAESGVDPYLLAGLMISESSGNIGAVSHKGALGLFQLMPETARWRAEKLGIPAPTRDELLTDAFLNARLGADNLAWLLGRYDGNPERALVAYNAGPGRLARFEREAGGWEAWSKERRSSGNSEIFRYVDRVLAYAESFESARIFEADGM